jgi:hypothetical protein
MRSTKNELIVDLSVNMNINGTKLFANGHSKGIPGSGNLTAELNTENNVDAGFNLGILGYVLLTGLPLMSFAREGAINPFRDTDGVYKAVRTLTLNRDCGNLTSTYSVDKNGSSLSSTFNIEGKLDLPELKSINTTIETWVPNGPGSILGHFTMCWRAEDGSLIKGEADTVYEIPTNIELKTTQFREILIDFKANQNHLEQKERIILFTDELLKSWTTPNKPEKYIKPSLVKAG